MPVEGNGDEGFGERQSKDSDNEGEGFRSLRHAQGGQRRDYHSYSWSQ